MSLEPHPCQTCQFFSESHFACFHPKAWKKSYPFKEPGNPDLLNPDGLCLWWDGEEAQPVGRPNVKNRISEFFGGLFRPIRLRAGK